MSKTFTDEVEQTLNEAGVDTERDTTITLKTDSGEVTTTMAGLEDASRRISGELFDASKFDLPVPRVDGEKADTIKIKLGGGIEIETTDEAWLHYVDGLKAGQDVSLTVEALVAGKAFTLKRDDETGELTATYAVTLKAHTIYRRDDA